MFAEKIFESAERIEIFPESGRGVPEINCKNIFFTLGNYLLSGVNNGTIRGSNRRTS